MILQNVFDFYFIRMIWFCKCYQTHNVEKQKFSVVTEKKFRQINYLVISLS